MEPLANIAMLEARLGRDVQGLEKARAYELLKDASSVVREFTGQTISSAISTVRLAPRGVTGRYGIVLPQWPVVSVDTVVNDDAADVDVVWITGDFISIAVPVTVTYTHGWEPVPDGIIGVVCQVAGRAFGTTPDAVALSQVTLGSYSESASVTGAGAAAAMGGRGLLKEEQEALLRYRRPALPIGMLTPLYPVVTVSDFA